MKYKTVSTAEKRAMLEAAGEEWPIGSDGLSKLWASDPRRKSGGSWRLRSTEKVAAKRKYQKNPAVAKARATRWYRENLERHKELGKRWREANPEKKREHSRNRRKSLVEKGLCSDCGKEPLATTWFCNKCMDKRLSPLNLLKERRRNALKRIDKRQKEREAMYG